MGKKHDRAHPGALLDAYLDGELSRRERRQVEAHVRTCPRCRATLDGHRQLHAKLRTIPVLSCPEEVIARVQARCTPQVVRRWHAAINPRLGWRLGVVAATAAVALLILLWRKPWQPPPYGEGPPYTEEQVLQARRDVELAFAYVHHALRLSERTLEEEVLPRQVVKPLKRGVAAAFGALTQEGI
ncbi:MAG: zf-HC2 domain-containing protein [candidate division KSB1 bacterium]|nr:zf-HC2 domain-containing protein [candidate division KSB1 bacterium]